MTPRPARSAATSAALAVAVMALPTGTATGVAPAELSSAVRVAPLSASDQAVHDKLVRRSHRGTLGPDLAGLVTDAASGRVLWSHHPGERQLPASNTKLVTAVNALRTFGPAYRRTTRVVAGTGPGRVVLVGSGDPSVTGTQLGRLARTTAAKVRAQGRRSVRVLVDDSLFPRPSLPYGWRTSYVPAEVRAVRALVVNQHEVTDTSMDAGRVFARRLANNGVRVRAVVRHLAPAHRTVLAQATGSTMATMVATMLRDSDNDYAEALHRLVARRAGYPTTWAGAQAAQRRVLAGAGVHLTTSRLYDGSGLSRADRLSPRVVVAVLSTVFDGTHPALASLRHDSLAIAGRTGTLGPRYLRYTSAPTRCAAGLIEAKTGSLTGVIALSGFARGADGRVKLFSFLLNRVPATLATRQAVDRLASTVTGCW